MKRLALLGLILLLSGLTTACGTDEGEDQTPAAHSELSDLEVVPDIDSKGDSVLPTFDANFIVADSFYTDVAIVDGDTLQAFFEASPYGNRSWLADEVVDGERAADMVVRAAQEFDINPLMLLVRLQVEQGLVSKSTRPSQRKIDRALGCGCFDGASCSSAYRGFYRQMRCGAETHRKLYETSKSGNGTWVAGKARTTSDGVRVRPANHASAALYGYTPWVLRGRGGNWLVWNIARKFVRHLEEQGHIAIQKAPFVGTPCTTNDQCVFVANGEDGFCYTFADVGGVQAGFCTVVCEGACPDKSGEATTFCIEADAHGLGVCAAKAEDANEFCSAIDGTRVEERTRFTGGTSTVTANVCAPDVP